MYTDFGKSQGFDLQGFWKVAGFRFARILKHRRASIYKDFEKSQGVDLHGF
jgi:hypothetical protein